jgi:tyrosinase
MADGIRIRQGVHNLDAAAVAAFRDSYRQMMAISDNRGYGFKAGLHGTPGNWCWHHQQNDVHFSGQTMQLFLPWHRAYLYDWEMAMRDRVPAVTLPWWDWTLGPPRQSGLPRIFTDARGADGQPNPLLGYRMNVPHANPPLNRATTRDPHAPDQLPTQVDVDDALSRTDWLDFCDKLEDIHDQVHGWVSGDMGIVATAAYDPIFWSHHAMIDRIWWLWQARNGNGNIPPDLLDVVLAPFNFKVSDVLSANALGYDYAAAQTVVPVS